MPQPNALIFVDLASDDPAASGRFYAEVFGWRDDPSPAGVFHRLAPGGFFANSDGSDSSIGHLNLGVFNAANARPHPEPNGADPRTLADDGRKARVWILIGDDDSAERILADAVRLGATELWRDHYWATFNGYNHAFRDPWGNEIILWGKAGPNPVIPQSFTRE
ncbi:hypothetical protein BH09PSE6_BH09PSE6_15580 [soil metagenome]